MHWQSLLLATWRAAIAFGLVMLTTRFLNKQYVARLTYFDFTVGVTIGSLAGHIANDFDQSFWPVTLPLIVMAALGILTGWMAMRYQKVRALLQGEPTVVMQNGTILEDNMRRLRYNMDQLSSQLRACGVFDVGHVEFAVLEPGGQLSVLHRSQHRPVTPADLHLPTTYEGIAVELIMDGSVVTKNLRENQISEEWLMDRLRERGVTSASEVFFAALNTKGKLCIDRYEDQIHRPVDIEGRDPSTTPSPSVP